MPRLFRYWCVTCLSLGLLVLGSLMVPEAEGAEPQPEPSGAPRVSLWRVGDQEGVLARFGADIYPVMKRLNGGDHALDRVLLALAETPLTPTQVQQRSGLERDRVSAVLVALDSLGMVRAGGQGVLSLTVVVMTDLQEGVVRVALAGMARRVARSIHADTERLRRAYEASRAASDPGWDRVAPLILEKFLIDGTFLGEIGELEAVTGVADLYNDKQRCIPVFFLEEGDNFSSFGTNWYPFRQGEAQRELYVLHGALLERPTVRVDRFRLDPGFRAALFRITPEGGLNSLSPPELEMFTSLEWTSGERLLVPIVQAASVRAIFPLIETAARRAAEVMFEDYDAITTAYEKSPYAAFSTGRGDYVQACYHTLFTLIIEELERAGSVPPVPSPVPEHYGVYLVFGKLF